MEYY
ncbi:hypothetical protein RDI58_024885 [Solanum bulbocastanum]